MSAAVIPVADGPPFGRAAVYPKSGQSVAESVELAPDVLEAVVVDVDAFGPADIAPLQAVAASPTKPIRTARFISSAALVKMGSTMPGRPLVGIEDSSSGSRRLAELSVFLLAPRLTSRANRFPRSGR